MSTSLVLLTLLGMAMVTGLSRLAPLLLPRAWLQQPRLSQLNRVLPASVMTILLLSALGIKPVMPNAPVIRDVVCLLPVVFSYQRWQQPLLSILLGVVCASAWTRWF